MIHYFCPAARLDQLQYDQAAAATLEQQVEAETAQVARCQERVDDLSSKLTGGQKVSPACLIITLLQ